MTQADDHIDLAVFLADLRPVVEVDMSEDVAAVRVVGPDAADQLGEERDAALLEQLVVHRLVEVAEHVHVAPAQLDAQRLLEWRRHGQQSK